MVDREELVEKAREAKQHSYSPYSSYSVGAAALTLDGEIYTGTNIEDITLGMCSHAEQTALRNAISDGNQDFVAMAISVEAEDGAPPCGFCRQFIAEFCPDDFPILSDTGESYEEYTLGEVFPYAFRPQHVEEETGFGADD